MAVSVRPPARVLAEGWGEAQQMTRQRMTAQHTKILQITSGSWPLLGGAVGEHTLMPLIAGHRAADHKKEFMRKKPGCTKGAGVL